MRCQYCIRATGEYDTESRHPLPSTNFFLIAMYYVYVLQSTDGDLYYGSTNDLQRRLSEHVAGKSFATRGRKWSLAYYEAYKAESDARRRENQIKHHGHAKRWLKERIQDSLQEKN